MLTFVLCVTGHSKSIGCKACLHLNQRYFIHLQYFSKLILGFYLGVVEVNDCAIILDHVYLLNAGNIIH